MGYSDLHFLSFNIIVVNPRNSHVQQTGQVFRYVSLTEKPRRMCAVQEYTVSKW